MSCNRNCRRIPRRADYDGAVLAAYNRDRCNPCGAVSAELYGFEERNIDITNCVDSLCGCRRAVSLNRCGYWPGFAHPKWLSCAELYNRRRR